MLKKWCWTLAIRLGCLVQRPVGRHFRRQVGRPDSQDRRERRDRFDGLAGLPGLQSLGGEAGPYRESAVGLWLVSDGLTADDGPDGERGRGKVEVSPIATELEEAFGRRHRVVAVRRLVAGGAADADADQRVEHRVR